MKTLFTMFAALLTAGLFAAEVSPLTPRQFYDANWAKGNADAATVEAVEAGTLKLTGNPAYDDSYYRALFATGGCTDAEYLAKLEGVPAKARYWEHLPLIYERGTSEEVRQKVVALFEAGITSPDALVASIAKRGYARACFLRGELDAAPAEYHAGSVCYFTPQVFRYRLDRKTLDPREAFDVLVKAFETGDSTPDSALSSLKLLVECALAGNVPDAEMAAVLKRIDRRYCQRAVGTSGDAQKWGVFAGQIVELRKKY